MKLISPFVRFDDFYTSVKLVCDLFQMKTPACGTTIENHRGYPDSMKNGKKWAMRWKRDGKCLAVQWKDNKVVTVLSLFDKGNDYVTASRNARVDNKWTEIEVRKPMAIENYNKYMGGVALSDQRLANNNVLRKCM